MTNNAKALRGLWGANRGPKMSRKKKKERKIQVLNHEVEQDEDRARGWKAHR
jgi:hypothetical protein